MKVSISRRAEAELAAIGRYVAQFDVRASERLVTKIEKTIRETIAQHPESGAPRSEVVGGLRVLVVDKYLVCYVVRECDIRILRIFHGAQDLYRQF